MAERRDRRHTEALEGAQPIFTADHGHAQCAKVVGQEDGRPLAQPVNPRLTAFVVKGDDEIQRGRRRTGTVPGTVCAAAWDAGTSQAVSARQATTGLTRMRLPAGRESP